MADDMPDHRWQYFKAYHNRDGTAHVLVIDDSGGYIFADNLTDFESAEWAAEALNAALAAVRLIEP
jgi:hypothetical protein